MDTLTREQRSDRMRRVRATGNRSTEGIVEEQLAATGLSGWTKHPASVEGRPDFYFSREKLCIFVDGCFWHGCPKCGRIPKSRVEFWTAKIDGNRRRDETVRRRLRRRGYHVMRVWEHDVIGGRWIARLKQMLKKATAVH